jgi:hypothetical protein
MSKKRKVVWVGGTPITPVSAKEHRKIKKRIKKRYEGLRKRYPEVHGKVVDFISHSIEDGTLYISVRFKDKTDFSLRYACDMMNREYMRPIDATKISTKELFDQIMEDEDD